MNTLNIETKKTLLYIAIAFAFSIAIRFIWISQFGGVEAFHFNGEFMINTNDGYYWAEGARDILAGGHQEGDLSPVDMAPAQLTAFFAKILPISFESVIFYLPMFLSSLVVIPIILIAKTLKNLEMGLIAALLGSIAWSYYNRTMVGYFDTDMLNIVLPMFLLWSIIWAINTKHNIYLLLTGVDILIYRWWYPQSYSLEFSFFGLILLYTLIFERKSLYNYKLMAIMMFAMMGMDGYIRTALVGVSYIILIQQRFEKYTYYILGAGVAAFLMSGGLGPIWSKLQAYIFRESITSGTAGELELHYFSVMQTVREAGKIPFETFANRISGHTITFLISLGGYIYLLYRHRIMIFSLPMVGLGFLAYFGGLRFTIYAVPVLAFGIAFLITEIARLMPTQPLKYLSMTAFTLLVLFPNYKHIEAYKVPTVFNKSEVEVLDRLGKKASREDYVIAWWDYGYPIRFYADVKTLSDGGKHEGDTNFPVSYILTHPQKEAAYMARLAVEFTEKSLAYLREHAGDKNIKIPSLLEQMMRAYGYNDANAFLRNITTLKLPPKTRDIYVYLPYKMLNIYPTVLLFSNLDLMNGSAKKAPFFFISRSVRDMGRKIQLAQNVYLDKSSLELQLGTKSLPIRRFVKTVYGKDGKLHVETKFVDFTSNISVIYMASYQTFLIVDESTFNASYIQLFVLEHYDATLFEPVELTPHAKVYRLKI